MESGEAKENCEEGKIYMLTYSFIYSRRSANERQVLSAFLPSTRSSSSRKRSSSEWDQVDIQERRRPPISADLTSEM